MTSESAPPSHTVGVAVVGTQGQSEHPLPEDGCSLMQQSAETACPALITAGQSVLLASCDNEQSVIIGTEEQRQKFHPKCTR